MANNPKNHSCNYDIIIVGGGLVGASLAYAFKDQPLKIAIIEAASFKTQSQPNYDDRAIALSYGTRCVFDGMGLWQLLCDSVTPIKKIHVSDRGHFGATRLDCKEEQVEALGYVITARDLGRTVTEALNECQNVDVISPAKVTEINIEPDYATVSFDYNDKQKTVSTKLIVAADGGQSSIRKLLGIATTETEYHQSAIISNVTSDKFHQHVAYERFTDSGPVALLPMSHSNQSESRCGLVWTQPSDKADALMALDDANFLSTLQQRFGYRMGNFTQVGKRACHELRMIRSNKQVQSRVAIIGNAAHTLHPIAGQGFNLGVRDISTLAQVLVDSIGNGQDIGSLPVLQNYAQWRQRDQQNTSGFTDYLVKIFSNKLAPVALARNLGLVATDILPPIKHALAKHSMGIAGKLPRLARGLPL